MNDLAYLDQLRNRKILKYHIQEVTLRTLKIIALLAVCYAAWVWHSLLFTSLAAADDKIASWWH